MCLWFCLSGFCLGILYEFKGGGNYILLLEVKCCHWQHARTQCCLLSIISCKAPPLESGGVKFRIWFEDTDCLDWELNAALFSPVSSPLSRPLYLRNSTESCACWRSLYSHTMWPWIWSQTLPPVWETASLSAGMHAEQMDTTCLSQLAECLAARVAVLMPPAWKEEEMWLQHW